MQVDSEGDELARLGEWLGAGRKAARATVVSTWGSSPRPVGSHLVINEDGDFQGSVSGGCIEGAVGLSVPEVSPDEFETLGKTPEQAGIEVVAR